MPRKNSKPRLADVTVPQTRAERDALVARMTKRMRDWYKEYLMCDLNATEAIRRIDPTVKHASSLGYDYKHHPLTKAVVAYDMKELAMPSAEAWARISRLAQADMTDFISLNEIGEPEVDMQKAVEARRLGVVRKVRVSKNVLDGKITTEVELHDPLPALKLIVQKAGDVQADSIEQQTQNVFLTQINVAMGVDPAKLA